MNISKEQTDKYVLYTSDERYFVEYLLKELVLSNSISGNIEQKDKMFHRIF